MQLKFHLKMEKVTKSVSIFPATGVLLSKSYPRVLKGEPFLLVNVKEG